MSQSSAIQLTSPKIELLKNVPGAYWMYDVRHKVFFWSNEIMELFQIKKRENVTIENLKSFIHSDSSESFDVFFSSILKGETGDPVEIKAFINSVEKTLFLSSDFITIENSTVIVSGIVQDITERRALEIELVQNDEKLNKFAQLATEGCIILDAGNVIDVNPAFEKLSQYNREELIGKSIAALLTPESLKIAGENLKNNYTYPYELISVKKDKSLVPIEVQGFYFEYMGRTLRFTTVRDLTKLKEKEKLGSNLSVLIEMSKSKNVTSGNFLAALKDILQKTAEILSVSRVCLWQCSPRNRSIRRLGMYELATSTYSADRQLISAVDFIPVIMILMQDDALMINDVTENPASKNIPHSSFWPEQIKSLMQVQLIVDGECNGILSIENFNEVKNWSTQDMLFCKSAVDILTITFKSFQRLRAENKVKQKNLILHNQKIIIEEKNKDIVDSINYSKRIQGSFLKKVERLREVYPESFIFYRPKDIIGGDFYWYNFVDGKLVFAVADCTGHGVPGALMSVLGVTQINKVTTILGAVNPSVLLKEFDKSIKEALHDNADKGQSIRDGMEISLCVFDPRKKQLAFAAAMRPMIHLRNNETQLYKGDKITIGDADKEEILFTDHVVDVKEGDAFYFLSDGLQDQFGGEKKKKFSFRKIEEFILRNKNTSLVEQGNDIEAEFLHWKADLEQTDDVLFAGIKFF
ncbi:MAG: PAS domain S-box protein [Bacteroidia bacterium]|nr:PAS domain S-box protein [Bacteroidia bacterium]